MNKARNCRLTGSAMLAAVAMVVYHTAALAEEPAAAPKIDFARLRSKVAQGDKIGHIKSGMFCMGGRDITAGDKFEVATNGFAETAFKLEAKAQGLSATSAEMSAFDTAQPSDADFRVGGVISAMNDAECVSSDERKGVIELTIKWDIFSTRQQRVVYSKNVQSAEKLNGFEKMLGRTFMIKAFATNLRELLTDPEAKAVMAGAKTALPAVTLEPMHLPAARTMAGGAQTNAVVLRGAVVTILSDKGSGTGFYVSPGYLLTNRHVVGGSKYVKVKLEDGKELVGEVVREDGPRDVALLKTEPTTMPALSLRLNDPTVGEDVYAIGTPLSQKLSGTFTRGVLSGVRESEGTRFYQSDVAVNPGNSGGPLLDAAGNVVGITTMKLNGAAGLAFFVPMRDAVDRLALVFDAPGN